MTYVVAYIATAVVFLGLDAIWLSKIALGMYRQELGSLLLEKPNLAIAAVTAAAIWGGSAYEAMTYARRSRARAESIIQINVPRAGDAEAFLALDRRSIGAGVMWRLP